MGWFCYLVCFSCLFGCGFGVVGGVGGFISFWVWVGWNCVRVVTENLYIFVCCVQ